MLGGFICQAAYLAFVVTVVAAGIVLTGFAGYRLGRRQL